MEFSVEQIATMLEGSVEGDGSKTVNTFGKIQDAKQGALSFLANDKYEPHLYTSSATAIIVSENLTLTKPVSATLIRVKDPYAAFSSLLEFYEKSQLNNKIGIEEPNYIHKSALLGDDIYLGAFAYIGENCKIGNNVKIYPHVYIGDDCIIDDNSIIYSGAKLYSKTEVGKNCLVHAGAILGADGFGWAPQEDGTYKPIPQLGHVVLEDNVSIGANTTVDSSTFPDSPTRIKKGAKLDNLIIVAHNVTVGKNTVMAAQSGISGSSELGDNCIIGGQVGVTGHIKLANKTTVGAMSGVAKSNIKEGEVLFGRMAYNIKDYMKSYVVFKNLPEIQRRISQLEKKN